MAKVLLVEDDNNLREIYAARLTAEGYDIIAAQNGEEALSAAKQNKPDLVISDVMMPRISGFEMLDILRNTDELKYTKVIMLTALGQSEDRNRADNLGADKYLVKSQVTLEDIVNAAKELLSDSPGQVIAPSVSQTIPATPDPTPTVAPPSGTNDVTSDSQFTAQAATLVQPSPDEPSTPAETPVSTAQPTVPTPVMPADPTAYFAAPPVAPPAATDEIASATTPPASTPVKVADPDPITPHVSPQAQVIEPTDDLSAAPIIDTPIAPEPVAPASETEPTPFEAADTEPQTLADEEATIQAQIASFAASEQSPAASTNNDAVLDDAISKLTVTPDAATTPPTEPPALASPAAEPIDDPTKQPAPAPPADSASQVSGHKIIQPLTETEAKTTSIEELLAQEEAKEATQNETGAQPNTDNTTGDGPQNTGIDPNSIAL